MTRPDDWPILLKDRFPAYISWEHYERNLRQLAANTAQEAGVIRKGTSLLSGLLICGRCGLRMSTRYKDVHRRGKVGSSKFCVDDQGVSIQDRVRVKHARAPCSEGLQTRHVHTFRV